ncbi:uncharacterized protein GLRG_07655 [Colletotrichum graminicola M1.001]|uniref:Uncharacterized protein n=1 Tax=Colletotrichum graminicola (strain M1.001 / M2 / FGSC 10212) TaxID=645133 RepID=E3QP53_COLGM|nr:uncharacterized protein GLRG_07655 [Colletotrichum graminicola M1.001]EFQ32641.1 hypothetical protein GLRG_07655 [Colletotrichum graminicola M1.001]
MVTGLRFFSGRHILALTAAVPCCLFAKHVWDIYARIRPVEKRRIAVVGGISNKFKESRTLKGLGNPRDHVIVGDAYLMDLSLPQNIAAEDATDEVLLAAFVRGYFAGKVFAIERNLLQIARVKLVSYSGLATTKTPVWESSELLPTSLPSTHSILFGAFQVSHIELQDSSDLGRVHEQGESSIDFVFGADDTRFAGAHRFSVARNQERTGDVRILYEHMACNPTTNQPVKPDFLFCFHNFYAMLLFREGLAEVMQVLERGPQRQRT